MPKWDEITRNEKYQNLPPEARAQLKTEWFKTNLLPEIESKPSLKEMGVEKVYEWFMQQPDDTGQGYVTSMLGAAGRGFGEMVPGAIEGVGALTGSEGLREFGQDVRGGLEDISPVNPIYGESIPVKLSELGGQIGSVLATAGAGGLAGKALGGVGAAATGMRAAPLASAFLQGSAEGAREAEQYGMTGPEAYLRTLAGGATEAGTELLPFGMAAETSLAKRLLTGAPRTGTFLGAVGSEAGEEGLGQIASNIATKTLAPAGVETPDITAGALEAAAYGAAGGAMLGGVNALISTPPERQTQIQKDRQAEFGDIPKDTVPDQTNEEKMAAMEKGGVTVVSPDGKTAVIAPEPSMPDPADVAKTIGESSVEQLVATGNEASAAAQADFNTILAEKLGETPEPTIQPEQAAEKAGSEVTPSPAMEMTEKSSQTITGSNGEIAPEMPVPVESTVTSPGEAPLSEGAERVVTPEEESLAAKRRADLLSAAADVAKGKTKAQVSPAVTAMVTPQPVETQEDAPPEIPLQESLREEPQDRVESREAEETGAGDQLLSPATGEEEVAAFGLNPLTKPKSPPRKGFYGEVKGSSGQTLGSLWKDKDGNFRVYQLEDFSNRIIAESPPIPKERIKKSGGVQVSAGQSVQFYRILPSSDLVDGDRQSESQNQPPQKPVTEPETAGQSSAQAVKAGVSEEETQTQKIYDQGSSIGNTRVSRESAKENRTLIQGDGRAPISTKMGVSSEGSSSASSVSNAPVVSFREYSDAPAESPRGLSERRRTVTESKIESAKKTASSFESDVYIVMDRETPTRASGEPRISRTKDGFVMAIVSPDGSVSLQDGAFRPNPQTTAAETQTPESVGRGLGGSRGASSSLEGGRSSELPKVSPETESESREKSPIAEAAMSYLMDDLTDAQKAKWTPEMFAAAQAYFDGGGKDFESLQKAVKFPRVVSQAYLKADKAASEEQARIDKAQRATDAEIARAEREEKKIEAEMLKREEMRSKAIDSIIGASEKKKRKFGQVTNSDAIAAVAMLVSSKDVPGVLTTWTGTKEDFLRDPANQTADPEIYARIKAGELVEGFFNKGRSYVFLDGIGVSDEDMLRGEQMSVTPQVAAVRRVLLHESLVHRGIHGLPLRHRRLILNWVRQNSTPAELDDLAKLYTEYANWRNSDYEFEALAEELLAKKVDSLTEIPKDGPMAKLMDILRQIWDFIVGYKREPTLSDLKSVIKLLKSGAEALANDRLKDGGEVKLSKSESPSSKANRKNSLRVKMTREALTEAALNQATWRDWYEEHQETLDEFFGDYAQQFQDILSVTSQAASVKANVGLALKAFGQWHRGEAFTGFLPAVIQNLNRLRDQQQIQGQKISTYKRNNDGTVDEAVIDRHITRLLFGSDSPTKEQFSKAQKVLAEVAQSIGWAPRQVQAALWAHSIYLSGKTPESYGAYLKTLDAKGTLSERIGELALRGSGGDTANRGRGRYSPAGITTDGIQRYNVGEPQVRFSRPQFSSDTSAALSAGSEAARSTLYSERDMDIREAIRRAYEAMPKTNSVAVPIGELFAKTEELMPGVTQDEFSLVLQDLFEDNGAVLQEGDVVEPLTEQDRRYLALAEDEDANREELQLMVDEAAKRDVHTFKIQTKRDVKTSATSTVVSVGGKSVTVFRDPENSLWYFQDKGGLGDFIATNKTAAIQAAVERIEEEQGGALPSTEIQFRDWRRDATVTLPGYYLRFGDLPKGGKSVIGNQPGLTEKGVSVLKAWKSPDGVYVISSATSETGASDMVAGMEDRPIYIAYGEDTGEVGSDGEPLLKNVVLTEQVMNNRVVTDDPSYINQPITNNATDFKNWETIEPSPDPLGAANPVTRDDQGRIIPLSRRFGTGADISGQINVTTPEGRRAGFVVVMPRAAKASRIKAEDATEAAKTFQADIIEAGKGRIDTDSYQGNTLKSTEAPDHNVNAPDLYKDAAISLVDSLLKKHSITDIADSFQDPEFRVAVGLLGNKAINPNVAQQAELFIGAEIQNRLENSFNKERNPAKKRIIEKTLKNHKAYYTTATGIGQNLNAVGALQQDPRFKWMFMFNEAEKEMADKAKEKLDTITGGGTQPVTDTVNQSEEAAADEATKQIEESVEEDEDAALFAEGEASLQGEAKSIWERMKDILRKIAFLDRLDKRDASSAKASLSEADKNTLSSLPKEERAKKRAEFVAEFIALGKIFMGEGKASDTPAQKATRQKRKKMVDTAKKRAEAGKEIEVTRIQIQSFMDELMPGYTERKSIVNEVGDALLKAAEQRKAKPRQRTAIQDFVSAIKQTLMANIRGDKISAEQPSLGMLLAKTFAQQGSEAEAFAAAWANGRKKVRGMLAEMGVEEGNLDAELDAIMPPTPTLAYAPAAARKAISSAMREAGLMRSDLLNDPAASKKAIMEKFDEAAKSANLTEEGWDKKGRALAEKAVDESIAEAKMAQERAKKVAKILSEQAEKPVSLEDFGAKLAEFRFKKDKIAELFNRAKKLAERKIQMANDQAIRVLLAAENKLAQSAFFNASEKPDTIVKAFREQVEEPMERDAFKKRMEKMLVTPEMADKLFDRAARERDNARWKKAQDLLEGPNALQNLLRQMNMARPGEQAPFSKQISWREILSQKAKTVEEYRQRIFDAISANEAFQNLSDEQKGRLSDLFSEAWESKRTDILDRMLEREIERKRREGSLSEAAAKALQKSRNKIIELANLGGFDNDDLMKVLGEKFGIKTGFSEAEKARISELADKLQDETLNPAKRNKLAMEFAVTLAGASEIPVAEIIANWWTSSVLFGPQTIFSIGAAFVNGAYSITTIGTRRMLADLTRGDVKGAIEESILMLQGIAKYLGAFKQAGRRAWSYLWTGNVDVLGAAANDILGEINSLEELKRFKRHKLLAENLAKDPRALRRYVGMYLRFVNRLLTSLDAFNVMVTKAGTASLALRMSGMSTDNIIKAEKMLNLKAYKDQVIRDYFDNKAPTTQAEKALVDSYAEAEMYRAVDQLGGKMENADYLASESAMTMNPTGLGGFFYRSITGLDSKMKKAAEDYLEKAKKDWTTEKDLESTLFLGLAYLRQFAVQNLGGVAGYKFIRFASNKFNQGISYLPMVGLLRTLEAKGEEIKGKEAFIETIHRNQVIGAVLTLAAIAVVKALEEEPDDEERGNFWNGGWQNLTPDQKKQMLAKGQKEYTMGFKFNGRWYVFNYQNWPLNQVLAAIGSMSDQIRFSPKQWEEKGPLSKSLAGIVSGLKSTLEIPALSQLGTLVGNRLASKDPTEQTVDRLSNLAAGWVGGFVPRILKDLDFATQPELRKYKTLWEKTASHIPIYRRYVGEDYYDILGQPIKRNVIPGSREFMMGPTEPEYKILGALNSRNIFLTPANAEYRMVGKGRNRRRLTQEEADAYSLETGKGYRQMLLRYGQRALQMPTERARAFLSDKADEVRDRALKKVFRR